MKLWIEQEQMVATLPRLANERPTYYYNYKFSTGGVGFNASLRYVKVPLWMQPL